VRVGGDRDRDLLSLSDRLDRASERMTKRAERVKALADAFRPFYASLSDEQKAVAAVLLRRVAGGRGQGWRWMHSGRGFERN
jgi:hypothetical protein